MTDAGSTLFSTVQTELIENQLSMKLLKSVHTVSITGMFPVLEGNDINLVTTVFPGIEDMDIHFKTYVFRKTELEYPVFAHPTLVLKRDFEKNMKLQDDRLHESTNRESVVKFQSWIQLRELASDRINIFLLDRGEPFVFFANARVGLLC